MDQNDWVLVINAGSSSLKLAIVNSQTGDSPFNALAERLGSAAAQLTIVDGQNSRQVALTDGSMETALAQVLNVLPPALHPGVIGHRVVHGGERFRLATRIDQAVKQGIEDCADLAPLHNPANLAGIRAAETLFPGLAQVAVFDTAFHGKLPEAAYRYAIPEKYYAQYGVRRYGFHGTSHHYVSLQAAEILGRPLQQLQLITAHLGNGCSVAAVSGGHSVDTSMGMTPLEGLVMGTRSGDIDPGIIFWLAEQRGLTVAEISDLLNKQSGLLGLSSLSNDMRSLEQAAAKGDSGAQLAIEVFCFKLAKTIASMSSSLQRIDGLVFTGGIGENSSMVRARVLARLALLNCHCDRFRNDAHGEADRGHIEAAGSCPVLVIPTNEELMIARQTVELLAPSGEQPE